MEIGQVVDYCMEYNEVHGLNDNETETKKTNATREATQADWDAFWG